MGAGGYTVMLTSETCAGLPRVHVKSIHFFFKMAKDFGSNQISVVLFCFLQDFNRHIKCKWHLNPIVKQVICN